MRSVDNLATLIPLVTALVAALTAMLVQLGRLIGKVKKQAIKTEEVHKIVNSQRTELIDHIAVLTALLKHSGIHVPTGTPAVDDLTNRGSGNERTES